jgi:uncharacterized protein
MSRVRMQAWAGAALIALVGIVPAALGAQASTAEATPALYVSAEAQVMVAPDRAHIGVTVETRGRTPQLAGSENARIQAAVIAAIRRNGVESAQIQTRALQVNPEQQYPREGGRPTVVGYIASNHIAVEVRDLSKIGALVDAALSQGATNVSGPLFALANPDSARREALDAAVRKALADAQVMARAAGVQVGAILELSTEGANVQPLAGMRMDRVLMASPGAASQETQVESGLIPVHAGVRLRIAIAQ